jgi:flagellar biosynthetic protein FliR
MSALVAEAGVLTGAAQAALWAGFLVFLRVGAAMALLPAFGEMGVPVRVRLALALAFTLLVAPLVAPALPPLPAQGLPLRLALHEVAAGLIVGLGFRLLVHALQIAGGIIAQAVSLSQFFGGAGIEAQPAIGHLLTMGGLALAVSLGLHVTVAEYLTLSYDILPPGGPILPGDVADWGLGRVGQAFALAFSIAAPFLIASLAYNLALGAINRAMPQLMVAFVGAPALTLGGLALLALALPAGLAVWLRALADYAAAPLGAP